MNVDAIPPAAVGAAAAAARGFLRIEGGAESDLIEQVAASALLLGEAFTGALFVARDVEEAVVADGAWHVLGAAPVRAIAGAADLPADAFAIDIDAAARGWIRATQPGLARASVRYTAGIAASWETLPAPLQQGVVALAAHLFTARDGGARPPAAVAALWRPYRRMRIHEAMR